MWTPRAAEYEMGEKPLGPAEFPGASRGVYSTFVQPNTSQAYFDFSSGSAV